MMESGVAPDSDRDNISGKKTKEHSNAGSPNQDQMSDKMQGQQSAHQSYQQSGAQEMD